MALSPRTGISRIFRTEGPGIGDRVVVRRRVPGSEREVTDIVGHILSLRPLVVRPQEVGGLPSQAPAVEIDDAAVLTVRLMPERTVKNSQIRACEVAAARAFPGTHHELTRDGGWLMRHEERGPDSPAAAAWVNSAVPVGRVAGFQPVPTSEITQFYARFDDPAALQIPERIARPAERLVGAAEWRLSPEVIVMTRPLDDDLEDHDAAGDAAPCADAVITEDDAGGTWLALGAPGAPEYRDADLEAMLAPELLRWGAAAGATHALVQVVHTDRLAIARLRAAGFAEHHRHREARRRQ